MMFLALTRMMIVMKMIEALTINNMTMMMNGIGDGYVRSSMTFRESSDKDSIYGSEE